VERLLPARTCTWQYIIRERNSNIFSQPYNNAINVQAHIKAEIITGVYFKNICMTLKWPVMCWCAVKKLLTHSLLKHLLSFFKSLILPRVVDLKGDTKPGKSVQIFTVRCAKIQKRILLVRLIRSQKFVVFDTNRNFYLNEKLYHIFCDSGCFTVGFSICKLVSCAPNDRTFIQSQLKELVSAAPAVLAICWKPQRLYSESRAWAFKPRWCRASFEMSAAH